jgi:ribose transport system ATP-binding protein
MPILDLRNIAKRFGQTAALAGVNVSLNEGEVHALIGENGAGKSTLMNVISGGIREDSGSMEFYGKPYSPSDPLDARKNGIALIHQELSLAPHLSVAENIMMGVEDSRFGWLDRQAVERRADVLLCNFERSGIRPNMPVGKLSPAAQQVVEICRALAANAKIVLMDEPTSSLQREDVGHLFSLIRKLAADGISVIYISHFLEEVREIADSFTVMRDGKSVSTGKINDVTDSFLISQMVGRAVDNLYPRRPPYSGETETVLEMKELASPPALRNATLELKRGEIFGIAGLMGAGRTEMARAIFGIDKPNSGTITVKGRAAVARGGKPAVRLLQGLGYLSEDRKDEGLALKLSIADNVTITRYGSCSRFGWLDQAKQRRVSKELMQTLDIRAKSSEQSVQTLSGGNQQKVAIARLLHQQADILLLDEPTRGIDIGSKAIIYETIVELADQGKAILLISSYLPELFGMCNRLAVMTRGRLSPARPIDNWTPELVLEKAIGTGDGDHVDNANGH